jgi:hypothetical protein
MAAVATRRKLLSFARSTPTIFLNLNQNPNFLYILSSSHPHFSTSSGEFIFTIIIILSFFLIY